MATGDYTIAAIVVAGSGFQEYRYSGVVLDNDGMPVRAGVLALSYQDDSLVGQTESDLYTGAFSLTVGESCYCAILPGPRNRNAMILAKGQVMR